MNNGFVPDKELKPFLESMCKKAEQMPLTVQFDISNLMTSDEWMNSTKYSHVTLGQKFRCRVDNGKVEGVQACKLQKKGKRTQYVRYTSSEKERK